MSNVNYIKPEIISYAHHAFPLGIIRANPNSESWFLSNYINLYYRPGLNSFNFLVEYDNNPFLDMRNVYKKELDWFINNNQLHEWIRFELDNGIAVELIIDYYYLSLSKYYHQKHFMHEIMITNHHDNYYDFWWFNNDQYTKDTIQNQEIVPYNSEIVYGDGIIAKLLSPKNSTFHFNEEIIWKQLQDYYSNTHIYEHSILWGDNQQYSTCKFGIQCIDFLIGEILNTPNRYIDYRYINVFYEHKKVMYQRFTHMQYNELSYDWLSLQNTWKAILYSSLRYNKYLEMQKSVPDQLEKILNQIISARDAELALLEKSLISCQ